MNDFTVLLLIATISGVLAEVFSALIISALKKIAKKLFAAWSKKRRSRHTLRLKH